MQFFQECDPDSGNDDTPISLAEKGAIMAAVLLVKLISRKLRKAQTQGDLYKVMRIIESKAEKTKEKYDQYDSFDDIPEERKEAVTMDIITDINELSEDLN